MVQCEWSVGKYNGVSLICNCQMWLAMNFVKKLTSGWLGWLNDCRCWDDQPRQLKLFINSSLSNCEAGSKTLCCYTLVLQCVSFHHCGHTGKKNRSVVSFNSGVWQWNQWCTSHSQTKPFHWNWNLLRLYHLGHLQHMVITTQIYALNQLLWLGHVNE
jgi:hypothetical protein